LETRTWRHSLDHGTNAEFEGVSCERYIVNMFYYT
jgi:hypothetical protein